MISQRLEQLAAILMVTALWFIWRGVEILGHRYRVDLFNPCPVVECNP